MSQLCLFLFQITLRANLQDFGLCFASDAAYNTMGQLCVFALNFFQPGDFQLLFRLQLKDQFFTLFLWKLDFCFILLSECFIHCRWAAGRTGTRSLLSARVRRQLRTRCACWIRRLLLMIWNRARWLVLRRMLFLCALNGGGHSLAINVDFILQHLLHLILLHTRWRLYKFQRQHRRRREPAFSILLPVLTRLQDIRWRLYFILLHLSFLNLSQKLLPLLDELAGPIGDRYGFVNLLQLFCVEFHGLPEFLMIL